MQNNLPMQCPPRMHKHASIFELEKMRDGYLHRCLVCNSIIPVNELLWDDSAVPTCPVCFTTDMLAEIKYYKPIYLDDELLLKQSK